MAAWLVRILGVLLMLSAIALALGRAEERPARTLVARWAPPPSDFIDVNGMVVHLRDEGREDLRDGPLPPLLLLHGTAASLHTWEGWVRALKTERRVISVDLPGFGLTGPFAGRYNPDDYRGDAYVQFVLDLLDALHIRRAVIAGNSLGGQIAWRTAARAPERVAGLVLVDASGLPSVQKAAPQALPLAFVLARVPLVGRLADFVLPRALVKQGLVAVYGDPAKVTDLLVDRYFELALRSGNRRALRLRLQQMETGQDADRIALLKLPTLILWGGRDHLVPPAAGMEFERRIAGSKRVVFDTLGHVPQEEDPAATVAPVKAFLAAIR